MKGKYYNKKIIKKTKIIIPIVIILTLMTAGIVYACYTANAGKVNNIKLGYNKIELLEKYNPPIEMQKGISFEKEPYVLNSGNVDCYVRIKSAISDSRVADFLTIDYNTTDYTYDETTGYWYYNDPIEPGEQTSSLFTTVTIAEDADDIILDGFDIYVYAESVQTVAGKTMQELWAK